MYQPDTFKREKTEEEYQAQAMLLGMEYYRDTHTFVVDHHHHRTELDADTMEAVPHAELRERMDAWLKHRRGWTRTWPS